MKSRPLYVPGWLQDREGTAPCPCGQPQGDGPIMEATHVDGLKRWFHGECWMAGLMMIENDDEKD